MTEQVRLLDRVFRVLFGVALLSHVWSGTPVAPFVIALAALVLIMSAFA